MKIIGIGNDIVNNQRLNNDKLINRFLSKKEKEIFYKKKNLNSKLEFLGGRWSAKEAIIKASDGKFKFSNIEILNSETGKPIVYIDGKIFNNILISISHEKEYSVSFCLIYDI